MTITKADREAAVMLETSLEQAALHRALMCVHSWSPVSVSKVYCNKCNLVTTHEERTRFDATSAYARLRGWA